MARIRFSEMAFAIFIVALIIFMFLPIVSLAYFSFSADVVFSFPLRELTLKWFGKAIGSEYMGTAAINSIQIALLTTFVSVFLATLGALAYVRYDFRGKSVYKKFILLPIFFPQAILGLINSIWLRFLGFELSWMTAFAAHLAWIAPVVTMVIAIQVFNYDPNLEWAARDLGASTFVTFREITLPLLAPGILSGAIFAFLLSWENMPLSIYTTGMDRTLPVTLLAMLVKGMDKVPQIVAISTLILVGTFATFFIGYLVAGKLFLRGRY